MRTILISLLLLSIAVVSIASCDTNGSLTQPQKPSPGNAKYETPGAALRAADALRASGANAAALAVAADAYRRFPDNPAVVSAYGRLALINGDHALAARLLRDATAAVPDDWRALSALGVLDSRSGRSEVARSALIRAASGGNAVALNNLAVSYLLDRKPGEAVALLRRALNSPLIELHHRRRMTHNLALALAMDGQFQEADALAGAPMPRELRHASAAAVRRFMGWSVAAKSWRPVEVPFAD